MKIATMEEIVSHLRWGVEHGYTEPFDAEECRLPLKVLGVRGASEVSEQVSAGSTDRAKPEADKQ